MRMLLLTLLVAYIAAPALATDPVCADAIVETCVGEHQVGDGSCETYDREETSVDVWWDGKLLTVMGYETCRPAEGKDGPAKTHGVGVSGLITFDWQEFEEPGYNMCYMYVTGGIILPCVVSPPNPGWGHLLP